MVQRIRQIIERLNLEHYTGSLDFDCDFCETNSYDNFHIYKDDNLQFVVCAKCLDKAHEKTNKKGALGTEKR